MASSFARSEEYDFYWLRVVKDKVYNPGTEDEMEESIQDVVNYEQCVC